VVELLVDGFDEGATVVFEVDMGLAEVGVGAEEVLLLVFDFGGGEVLGEVADVGVVVGELEMAGGALGALTLLQYIMNWLRLGSTAAAVVCSLSVP